MPEFSKLARLFLTLARHCRCSKRAPIKICTVTNNGVVFYALQVRAATEDASRMIMGQLTASGTRMTVLFVNVGKLTNLTRALRRCSCLLYALSFSTPACAHASSRPICIPPAPYMHKHTQTRTCIHTLAMFQL